MSISVVFWSAKIIYLTLVRPHLLCLCLGRSASSLWQVQPAIPVIFCDKCVTQACVQLQSELGVSQASSSAVCSWRDCTVKLTEHSHPAGPGRTIALTNCLFCFCLCCFCLCCFCLLCFCLPFWTIVLWVLRYIHEQLSSRERIFVIAYSMSRQQNIFDVDGTISDPLFGKAALYLGRVLSKAWCSSVASYGACSLRGFFAVQLAIFN